MLAEDTVPATDRGHAMALIDLPDDHYGCDLYVINAHFKSAGGLDNIKRRLRHADAIVHWIGDLKSPGGRIDLPTDTPVIVLGDLNVYDTDPHFHLTTLLTGDIVDEQVFGPDLRPDWDDSDLTTVLPLHNGVGPDNYTWRDDSGDFTPGPLDHVIYTDSVMSVANAFILNTTLLSPAELKATGLQPNDVVLEPEQGRYDHLPLVVDFRLKCARANNEP
jgi:endonuclease/exonuclease/phosphatase family metal-dependent hydrolase